MCEFGWPRQRQLTCFKTMNARYSSNQYSQFKFQFTKHLWLHFWIIQIVKNGSRIAPSNDKNLKNYWIFSKEYIQIPYSLLEKSAANLHYDLLIFRTHKLDLYGLYDQWKDNRKAILLCPIPDVAIIQSRNVRPTIELR